MRKGTLIALAVNNLVIAGAILSLNARVLIVEGQLDRTLGRTIPLLLRQLSNVLQLSSLNEYYIKSIIAFLSQ